MSFEENGMDPFAFSLLSVPRLSLRG
jgi:hypothetical protein